MPNAPLYPHNYPGPGQFALLCEGDLTGYEAAILNRWLRDRVPAKDVDVRACGTAGALFGMADAIGRTVRVVVVEDLDFRSPDQAKADCYKKCADREEHSVAMRGWVTWSRNEIENYFLDDEVLFPAMREVFECSDSDVKAARDEAINALRLFQVVQASVSDADVAWAKLVEMRRRGGGRPKWGASGLEAPEVGDVRGDLEKYVTGLQAKAYKSNAFQEPFLGKSLLDVFDSRWMAWSVDPLPEGVWKREWAGKEVLKLLRQQLAGRFSAPIASEQKRIDKVDWFRVGEEVAESDTKKKAKMQQVQRDRLDRDIERAMQPRLIEHLWAYLDAVADADMNADLGEIARCLVT